MKWFEQIAEWSLNLSFILVTYCACVLFMKVIGDMVGLSTEAIFSIAGLLVIGLSDLYLGGARR